MHFGIISPPVPGHLHPMGALGRELIARGHQVTLIHMKDLQARAAKEELRFAAIGEMDHPAGSLAVSLASLGKLEGMSAVRFTVQAVRNTTEMFCRDAPELIRRERIGMLLVDQTEPAGGTVADYLKLPFVTIANALALNSELTVPPPFSGWRYSTQWWAKARNFAGYYAGRSVMRPVTQMIAKYRQQWNLPPQRKPEDSFSPLAQICQLPAEFDYPRINLPQSFHYVGPLRRAPASHIPFPWEQLDGRPLIYASLGTLQNSREAVFRCFAQACIGVDAQLVISHGGGLGEASAACLPGSPIVVSYAPQLELLGRAALTITHAGLNTVLDSLSNGVPMVAVPITYEQPAIAARIKWSGTGEVIPFRHLNVERLRQKVELVLKENRYRRNAGVMKERIRLAGGIKRAADLIESLIRV